MACFIIAQIDIHDREAYQVYIDGYDKIFAKYRGRVLIVDEDPVVLEGEWPWTRTVVIRFPDEAEARRWFESEEYQLLATHRRGASTANIILVNP